MRNVREILKKRPLLFDGGMQVAGTRIVAQALPQPQHLVLARRSQSIDSGKLAHEPLPVFPPLGDTRLLQYHLAQPDGIRVGGVAPRQSPAVIAKP